MDVRMPVMDGIDATRRIREHAALTGNGNKTVGGCDAVVIIALSASAFEHERESLLRAGCNDFLAKPFRTEELFQKIADHLPIKFIYECASPTAPVPNDTNQLTAERLNSLPSDWLVQLANNLSLGDIVAALSIVDQIEEKDH